MRVKFGSIQGVITRALVPLSLVLGLGCDPCAEEAAGAGAAAKPNALPLKHIVLYSSGVGFFERGGEVEGAAEIDLEFKTDAINDLLKSLVFQDLGGGKIAAVTYGSKDPVEKTLETFSLDLAHNPSLADLLRQARGEAVEIDTPERVAGTIVGVETRKETLGDGDPIDVDYLTLFTKEGLKRLALRDVGRIQFARAELNQELARALAVLATSHATGKKAVTLKFEGEGKREVRVGYNTEAPIWKTTYRLVLGKETEPMLQGWAIVENTTDEDWNDVSLKLVAGRPISFTMDLYEPLYLERPVVEPELFASLRPRKHDQAMSEVEIVGKETTKSKVSSYRTQVAPEAAPAPADAAKRSAWERQMASSEDSSVPFDDARGGFGGGGFGGSTLATGTDLGKLFQYTIDGQVKIPRQKSAMLPIVNDKVEAEKVSVYAPQDHPKHPLAGIRLKNSTTLHLAQGPITVFDNGAYAGDGQIDDLPAGGERLVTYAVDLDVEVAPTREAIPAELVSVKIANGALVSTHKARRETTYAVKNSGKEMARVLIEYPLEPGWKLLEPEKPAETTRDRYRLEVKVDAGKSATLRVVEERTVAEQVALTNLDDDRIRLFLSAPRVSQEAKEALELVAEKKRKVSEASLRLASVRQEIEAISGEQNRIRQNMQTLDKTSDLYRRYVKKFGEQEDQIEKLNGRVQEGNEELEKLKADLDATLSGLRIDN